MMRFKDVEESKRRIFYNIYQANVFAWLDDEKAAIQNEWMDNYYKAIQEMEE